MIKAKNTVLLVYADWCMHCKMFKPTWASLIDRVKKEALIKKNFQLLAIESEVLNKLASSNKKLYDYITKTKASPDVYFPKLMVFLKSGATTKKAEYTKDKSEDSLYNFLVSKLPVDDRKALKAKAEKKTAVAVAKPAKKQGKKAKRSLNEEENDDNANLFNNQYNDKNLPQLIDEMINKYLGL
jgi:thiol-disulfide isomerase/thioredoxin